MRLKVLKIYLIIAAATLLCTPALAADLDYVMAWTAKEMKIEMQKDIQKPLIIRFGMQSCVKESIRSILIQTTFPLTSEAIKNIEFFAQNIDSFYYPRANIVFLSPQANDGLLAHEIVHYFQSKYRNQINSYDAEIEALVIERRYCREHGLPIPNRL